MSSSDQMAGSRTAASLSSWRRSHPVVARASRLSRPAGNGRVDATPLTDLMITGLMLLVVITTLTISTTMLTDWHVHYATPGGIILEKFHPATYFTFLAFFLLLVRHGNPVGQINLIFSDAKLVLVYLFAWFCLLLQMLVLERPFTAIVDTFLQPAMLCLIIWQLSAWQKKPLVWSFHLAMLLNVVLGYYEYFSGHRLFPLILGDVTVMGEWRSAALLGHPLTASGLVGGYVLALVLRPRLCPPAVVRLPLIAFCLASLMAFGGRTSLVTVLCVLGLVVALELFRVVRGGRTSLPMAVVVICLLFVASAGIFAAFESGFFDKMLLRFSSDKGSTLARYATFSLLSHFDWSELILGPNPVRASALATQYGLAYGIEDFWVSCAVQFGIVCTALLSIGLGALFVEIARRSSGAVWAIILLMLVIAASSVSFSSKNIQLSEFILLIALLLPRDPRAAAPPLVDPDGRRRPIAAYS
jgi:hypothetical protein